MNQEPNYCYTCYLNAALLMVITCNHVKLHQCRRDALTIVLYFNFTAKSTNLNCLLFDCCSNKLVIYSGCGVIFKRQKQQHDNACYISVSIMK